MATVVLSLAAAPAATALAVAATDVLRGANTSDVGVPMYDHGELARGLGAFILVAATVAALALVQRTVGCGGRLTWIVGAPWLAGWLIVYLAGTSF